VNPQLPQYFMCTPPLLRSCSLVVHLGQLSGSEGSLGLVSIGLRCDLTLPLSKLLLIGVAPSSPALLNCEVAA